MPGRQWQPQPGDFGLVRVRGALGAALGLGQLLNGDASRYAHVFVVVDNGEIVEAMPGGARVAPLALYEDRKPICFSDIPLTDEQRRLVVHHARSLVGTPYNFIDYLALALMRLHVPIPHLKRFVADPRRMICSQLVDECYRRAGVHLFDDGRPSHDVTPGDLANMLIETDWSQCPPSA